MPAHFRIVAAKLSRPVEQSGTLTINRNTGIVSIRPKGEHRTYSMAIDAAAEILCQRIIKRDTELGIIAKREAKKGGR